MEEDYRSVVSGTLAGHIGSCSAGLISICAGHEIVPIIIRLKRHRGSPAGWRWNRGTSGSRRSPSRPGHATGWHSPGGYAVSAHGIGSRPSGDVDLFTSWQHRDEFSDLTAVVISALETSGYKAATVMSAGTFARLTVTNLADGAQEKVELSVDWRAHDGIKLFLGSRPS